MCSTLHRCRATIHLRRSSQAVVIDNLGITWLSPAASTRPLDAREKVMLASLWRLVHRTQPMLSPRQQDDSDELSWLRPPANPLDVAAWDRFWVEHIRHGIGPPLMDMFCDDSMLVRVMNDEGLKSILCAGNGISQEPKALAAAGMDVVAMDISPQAAEIAKSYPFPLEAISQYYEPELQK